MKNKEKDNRFEYLDKDNRYIYLDEENKENSFDSPKEIAEKIGASILKVEEAMKFDNGKPPVHLVDKELILETAKILGYGAEKYEAHNWRMGIPISRYFSAAQRHLLAWNDGEDIDPESGLLHLAHASCNLMFLLYHTKNNPQLDDRFNLEKNKGGKE